MNSIHSSFVFMLVFGIIIIHILSKTYVEEFRFAVSISTYEQNNLTDESIVLLQRNIQKLKTLQMLKENFKYTSEHQIENTDKSLKNFMVKDTNRGGFTQNSDKQISCLSDTTSKVLILMRTSYKDIGKRMAARDSWSKQIKNFRENKTPESMVNWKLVFVVSTPDPEWEGHELFDTEMKFQRDMLQVERQESATQDSIKLYSSLLWAWSSCKFEYLLVVDSGSVINVPSLYNLLHASNLPKLSVYLGYQTKIEQVKYLSKAESDTQKVKSLRLFTDYSFLLSNDVLGRSLEWLKWHSIFSGVNKPMVTLALSMQEISVKPITNKSFLRVDNGNCTLHGNDAVILKVKDENCYKRLTASIII